MARAEVEALSWNVDIVPGDVAVSQLVTSTSSAFGALQATDED